MFPIPKLPDQIPQVDISIIETTGSYNPMTGQYEETETVETSFKVREDKKLYCERTLEVNSIIEVNGKRYIISNEDDYEGLTQTNFRRYFIKRRKETSR